MGRKKGVIFSYILMVIESLSSILFTPYLIRCLGESEYGIYGLVASVTAYLYLLDLGVGNAIVRYMAKYRFDGDKNSERNLMATTMIFYGIIAVIVIVVGLIREGTFRARAGVSRRDVANNRFYGGSFFVFLSCFQNTHCL